MNILRTEHVITAIILQNTSPAIISSGTYHMFWVLDCCGVGVMFILQQIIEFVSILKVGSIFYMFDLSLLLLVA